MADLKTVASPELTTLHTERTSPLRRLIVGIVLMTVVVGSLGVSQLLHTRKHVLQQSLAGISEDFVLAEARQELLIVAALFGIVLCMSLLLLWQVYRSWQKTSAAEQELKSNYERLVLMQAQMMQNDKLATIGQLAAGVAHEINNPMGFVGSNMATLAKYIEKYNCYINQIEQELCSRPPGLLPDQIQDLRHKLKIDYVMRDISVLVDESNEGIERVKQIVRDLKTFSRADSSSIGSADLNSCMESTVNIVINEIKYAAELKREYGDIPNVSCNAQQINQVFMNLLINAAHSIQDKGDMIGEITIRTRCDQDDVFVSVSDTGCGIAAEHSGKIFDAFFTTKEVGKGTGLGLSISSGIIRKHGGDIFVESEVGKGSTFTVRLPLNPPETGENMQ